MSRLKNLFQKKLAEKKSVLNIYCTAGFPKFESTLEVMHALQNNGADIIELGIPYSDPLADGPVIQASSAIALKNGMTIKNLFEQLKDFRKQINLPVILMGYLNLVLQYGFEKFCSDAAEVGVDGLIIPDLPEYEFESEYQSIIKKFGLDFIFLITPETSEERILKLDSLSDGFLYAVSSTSTTGSENKTSHIGLYLKRLRNFNLKNPLLVGFGIKDKSTYELACDSADGAIIGSAYIQALNSNCDTNVSTKLFLKGIRD